MPKFPAPVLLAVLLAGCGNDGSPGDSDATDTGNGDTTDATDTGGTTDSTDADTGTDATDTSTDTGTDTDGIGEADSLAMAACDLFANGTPQPIIAAATAGEAATASLVADSQVVYQVTLPEGAPGFVELQIPDWNTTQAFFTTPDIEYTITTMQNAQVPGPRELAGSCPDAGITDQRVLFPHWTPATIEFGAEGPRDILLMIIRQP